MRAHKAASWGWASALFLLSASAAAGELTLSFSTWVAAAGEVRDVCSDSAGNVYITGGVGSTNFPTTPGAYSRTYNGGNQDAQ